MTPSWAGLNRIAMEIMGMYTHRKRRAMLGGIEGGIAIGTALDISGHDLVRLSISIYYYDTTNNEIGIY